MYCFLPRPFFTPLKKKDAYTIRFRKISMDRSKLDVEKRKFETHKKKFLVHLCCCMEKFEKGGGGIKKKRARGMRGWGGKNKSYLHFFPLKSYDLSFLFFIRVQFSPEIQREECYNPIKTFSLYFFFAFCMGTLRKIGKNEEQH